MILEQLKYDDKYIEMPLGHSDKELYGRAYNLTQYLDESKKMLQEWANYLDELKS